MRYTVFVFELYIANKNYSSWSLRPWVLLSEMEIPFVEHLRTFDRDGSGRSAGFRAFSPSGMVPCLHDGSNVVWDSLAITEYVGERHAAVWPKNASARAWARSAAAEMHSGFTQLRATCGMNCGLRVQLHRVTPGLQSDLERLTSLWRDGLSRFGGPFLAGDMFTAVDAFFAPVAFRIQTYQLSVADDAAAYAQRLRSLASMQRWYQAALAETTHDPSHDNAIPTFGSVIADLRAQPPASR